ncbi:MAG: TniQ family protein [Clostridia bacterium]|nr:TniQ family protein [Clostridia bacterium]
MNTSFLPIPEFVEPYPDENCYSILSRCAVRSALSTSRFRSEMFRNKRDLHCLLWQPFRMEDLSRWFDDAGKRVQDYLKKHSCASYRYPFLEQRNKIHLQEWQDGELLTKGQYVSLARDLGYRGWKEKYLRYCPECVKEDRETYGETYWHMIPQLPGVTVCPVHMVPLENSVLTWNNTKYDLLPAEYWLKDVRPRKEKILYDDLCVAADSKWMMENGWNSKVNFSLLTDSLSVWQFEQAEAKTSLYAVIRSVKAETLYFILLANAKGMSIADCVTQPENC